MKHENFQQLFAKFILEIHVQWDFHAYEYLDSDSAALFFSSNGNIIFHFRCTVLYRVCSMFRRSI
jgi:hypothetical protein